MDAVAGIGGIMPKILEDKRRYLYAVYVDDTNVIVRWLLQFGWFRDKWERYWKKRVNRMTEGEVLKEYYEKTRRNGYDIGLSRETQRYIEG